VLLGAGEFPIRQPRTEFVLGLDEVIDVGVDLLVVPVTTV
jgi:hypothetical protein